MNNETKNGKKVKKLRREMPEQDPKLRIKNFHEVNLGYSEETSIREANRCLQCGKPLCIEGCPVDIDIPTFIKQIKEHDFVSAINCIKDYNLLPAICGRVCPQEDQCEGKCVMGKRFEPIAIGNLERFLADWEREHMVKSCPDCQPPNGIRVAVVGSGPAGLTCAADLARKGYDVTVYEAFHKAGGVLAYGIPEFRLPKAIVEDEVETLKMMGVKFKYNMVIGKILTIDDLKEMGNQAIFLGIGAGTPRFLRLPGRNLSGVVSANEYLTRVNLMKGFKFPKYHTPLVKGRNVTVIGGGNVAMDSARSALRTGANSVTIVYRRGREQMPAREEEIHHAEDEGVCFRLLRNPVRFIGNENKHVEQMEVIKMRLGEPDKSGRPRPIPIEGSEFKIETDLVIVAIGNNANPLLTSTYPELKTNKWGYIETDEMGRTNLEGIYAGGDIVTGGATVISAMGAGRKAARAIDMDIKKTK
ncbi:MAG: NADPH-dependent glutamate synthase [Promethearchaeia archaeon]